MLATQRESRFTMIFVKHPELSASAIRSLSRFASTASGSTSSSAFATHHSHRHLVIVAAVSTRRGCTRSRVCRYNSSRVCGGETRRRYSKRAVDISIGHAHGFKRCTCGGSHLYTSDAQKKVLFFFDFDSRTAPRATPFTYGAAEVPAHTLL
jgi:hypothetical protein